jgi:ribosome-associated translation inhibitor RaiA
MIIQVNTDSNIQSNRELMQQIKAQVENSLERFGKITRVEVHLSDENSDKKSGTKDMRCLLEARLAGFQPVTVSHKAATMGQAIEDAVEKLKRSLDSTLERLGER